MMFGSVPFAGTITERPIGITSAGGVPCRPTRGWRTRVNWPGGSFPMIVRVSWPSLRSASAWSSACSTTPPQKDQLYGTTMPTFTSSEPNYSRAVNLLEALAAIGPRQCGTEAAARAAEAVADAFRSLGLEPRFEEFPLLGYD